MAFALVTWRAGLQGAGVCDGDGSAGGERGGHVNDALVAAAAEQQVCVTQVHHEWAVDHDVNVAHGVEQALVGDDLLPRVAGVEPDVVAQLLLDERRQAGYALRLIERVAARECYGQLLARDGVDQSAWRDGIAAARRPRLRVVTTRARVVAAGEVDARAQVWPVNAGAVDYAQYL